MIPLPKDPRVQRFADLILGDVKPADAYVQAGFKPGNRVSAQTLGTRMRRRADVQAYIRAIQQAAANETVLSVLEKRRFLARIVRTPLCKLDPERETDGDLIKSHSSSSSKTSSSTRIEKLDPLKAIEIDNKLSGDDAEANALTQLAAAIDALASASPVPTDRM